MLAAEVIAGRTRVFDEQLLLFFRDPEDLARPIGPPALAAAAKEFTALGSATVANVLIVSVAGYLFLDRRVRMMLFVLVATYGGMVLTLPFKGFFQRARPSIVPHLVTVVSLSFPSGHAVTSAVVFLTLGALLASVTPRRSLKIYFVTIAILITFLVGLTRIYTGVHYPTDVMAGWAIGLVWSLLCGIVARHLQRKGMVNKS